MYKLIIPENLDSRINNAARYFWETRLNQTNKKSLISTNDQGNRGAVTGGKQLDNFVDLIKDILIMNGIDETSIFINSNLELPGYYRPNKKWDLLVIKNKKLLAAMEFKSQVGPSFGNNFNNRTEEAMGSAIDFWTAYRECFFGFTKAPWLGYFMLMEECEKSTVPVKIKTPHFNSADDFINVSYEVRYEMFCKKLILERQYNAACFLTTKFDNNGNVEIKTPNKELSLKSLVFSLLGSIIPAFQEE